MTNGAAEFVEAPPPAQIEREVRPIYWSVRREVWEHRSIYIAPLIVAAVFLFGYMLSLFMLPRRMEAALRMDAAKQERMVTMPYSIVASIVILAGFVIAANYCLEALMSERRDRSILFWKSLPVSDREAVLAKVAIPLVVQPVLCFVIALGTQIIMLFLSTTMLMANGPAVRMLWSRLSIFEMTFTMAYGITAHILWYAPIYAWLLLVSAWTRRFPPFLWAILPVFAPMALEAMVSRTDYFAQLVKYRLGGALYEAFNVNAAKKGDFGIDQIAPLKFLMTPGLWVGLIFAAIFIAAAVRLRRNREPI